MELKGKILRFIFIGTVPEACTQSLNPQKSLAIVCLRLNMKNKLKYKRRQP